jgi:hypothetical protein
MMSVLQLRNNKDSVLQIPLNLAYTCLYTHKPEINLDQELSLVVHHKRDFSGFGLT